MECALFVLNDGTWERHLGVYADVQTLLERIDENYFLQTLSSDKKKIIFGENGVLRRNTISEPAFKKMIEQKVVYTAVHS